MPLPTTTKAALLKDLHTSYEKLDSEFDAVSHALERQNGIEGDISCCDVLAYQIGWCKLLLAWDAYELNGNAPVMPCEGYQWNQLGALATAFYAQSSSKGLDALRAEFQLVFKQLIKWVSSLSEQTLFELHQRQWAGEKWPLVKWIQVNTIAPYRSARTKVRRWKREQAI